MQRFKKFQKIVGQHDLQQLLMNMVNRSELPSCIILIGDSGTGKTTLARSLSMLSNCRSRTAEFDWCGKCDSCMGKHLNKGLVEVDAALHSGVEQVRRLIEIARYEPIDVRLRFFIIDEVHLLSYSAQSAILKTLEESNRLNKFILVTTNPEKLQDGILNRGLCLQLEPLGVDGAIELIKSEDASFPKEDIDTIVCGAHGVGRTVIMLTRINQLKPKWVDLDRFIEGVRPEVIDAWVTSTVLGIVLVARRMQEFILKGYSSKDVMLGDIITCCSRQAFRNERDRRQLINSTVEFVKLSANLGRRATCELFGLLFSYHRVS